jgi:hypothetical protein
MKRQEGDALRALRQNRWGTSHGTTGEGWHTLTTSDGKPRIVSLHLRDSEREEVTYQRLVYVLDNWVVRGVFTDRDGEQSMCYYAFVPDLNHTLRVSVSLDDTKIVNGFVDGQATRKFAEGDWSYFELRLERMEVNAPAEES